MTTPPDTSPADPLDLDKAQALLSRLDDLQVACYGLPDGEASRAIPSVALDCAFMLPVALAELVQARADLADLRALFDLQWKRMSEATARWRAEDPEARALVMPDLGDLLQWLIGEQDRQREAVRRVCARIIANAHLLDTPFTDAPDLSPWVLLKRDMAALYAAVGIRFAVPDAEAPGGSR